MPCVSSVTKMAHDHIVFHCSGECSPNEPCHVHLIHSPNGGTRAWCGCGPEEPKHCHIVVERPNPNAPSEVICAGHCETGQKCELRETVFGGAVTYTCECVKG